ncbi:MAG: ATP-binding protein [Anaerolineales bacterium]|nr:ATP-binding protein [Anaerolineales bacterium]
MSDQNQTIGEGFFRPRARIMRTLGDELISSETVALLELVKNAYDADATDVDIIFEGPFKKGQGKIIVIDNGHGMGLETIQNTWLEPATLYRRRNKFSEEKKRRVLGEKGIGRFAASRLAETLELITRRKNTEEEIRVKFPWKDFDEEEKYLDQVGIKWEIRPPRIIDSYGMVLLWLKNYHERGFVDFSHGTVLIMENLRTDWEERDFVSIRQGLARLISPFFGEDEATKGDTFNIFLNLPEPYEYLSGHVKPPESLSNPHYRVIGNVDENGKYELIIKLKGDESLITVNGKVSFKDEHQPQCGPFEIDLRVWDRDRDSLHELAQKYNSTINDVRRDLDDAAGINIYRDGFRVLPYGEPRNDWLRLDIRRVQNPTRNLSNNQIVGYIRISSDKNPLLRDQSNREGLIESRAFDDLRESVITLLTELESRRWIQKHPKETMPRKGIFSEFNINTLSDYLKKKYPQDKELQNILEANQTRLDKGVDEFQRVLSRYWRLATLGQLVDIVLHDGRTPLAKISNEADLALIEIGNMVDSDNSSLEVFRKHFSFIKDQSNVLSTVFNRIEPFSGRKRGKPEELILEQIIRDSFAVLEGEIKETGVSVVLPQSNTSLVADRSEIQEIIINLLNNSLYWLKQTQKHNRKIVVNVTQRSDGEAVIIFSDSGPGVDPDYRDYIFDPYFSTKPDGVGLGLTIVGEIISEYYSGSLELLDNGPCSGATFRITLKGRK